MCKNILNSWFIKLQRMRSKFGANPYRNCVQIPVGRDCLSHPLLRPSKLMTSRNQKAEVHQSSFPFLQTLMSYVFAIAKGRPRKDYQADTITSTLQPPYTTSQLRTLPSRTSNFHPPPLQTSVLRLDFHLQLSQCSSDRASLGHL